MELELDKLKKWQKEHGLEEFDESEFLVTNIKRIDANTLEITAFVNIYLKNGELYSITSNILVKLR